MAAKQCPTKRKEKQKIAVLQHVAGRQTVEVYDTFNLEGELTHAVVVEKF